MKYSKEFYLLLAHINPALYDVIFPMGPLNYIGGATTREYKIGNYQTQGSTFGTDFSGDLKVFAKLSWKMKNLSENLRAVIIQAKTAQEPGAASKGSAAFISDLIDEYCGNGIKFPFPPKPHGFDDTVTIEEKVSAAIIFSQTASALEGNEIGNALNDGADKILDSAMGQLTNTATRVNRLPFNKVAVNS